MNTNIGLKIKNLREERGMTQRDLANILGTSVDIVKDIENNNIMLTYGVIDIIADIFYVTPRYIIEEPKNPVIEKAKGTELYAFLKVAEAILGTSTLERYKKTYVPSITILL